MEPIESGYFYHIYNRGINSCDLFSDENDFIRFLNLYEKYIDPVAETYAWCLMPNHFHFLVRIKEESEIGIYKPLNSDGRTPSGFKQQLYTTCQSPKILTELRGLFLNR